MTHYPGGRAMFERFTEKARRAIFFARYEASQFGSDFITPEHLLLGLLRDDQPLSRKLGPAGVQAVREYVTEHSPPSGRRLSVSVDLPLDSACKNALTQAANEADALAHRVIASGHLVLGLLRAEKSIAAEALRTRGIEYQSFRDIVAKLSFTKPLASSESIVPAPDVEPRELTAPRPEVVVSARALHGVCNALARLVDASSPRLDSYSEADGLHLLGRGNWLRKEALGRLIDWACTHQQWFARALTEPKLAANGYPGEDWVAAQKYREADWSELTDVWVNLNRLLVHVIAQVPESKLATPCRIGLQEAIPLERLIGNYVKYCQDEMAEILTRR
jgi:hypothetical protein